MARFMMLIYPPADLESWEPSAEDAERMMAYNEELEKAGVLLALDGLSRDASARVRFQDGGRVNVTDGPFAEAKELVGGYWIIQAKDLEEAVQWARRCPGGAGDTIEVRKIFELEDFSPEVQEVVSESDLQR